MRDHACAQAIRDFGFDESAQPRYTQNPDQNYGSQRQYLSNKGLTRKSEMVGFSGTRKISGPKNVSSIYLSSK